MKIGAIDKQATPGKARGLLQPLSFFPVTAALVSLLLGVTLGIVNPYLSAGLIGAAVLAVALILRQNGLVATIIVAVHLYVDWYLGTRMLSVVIATTLLPIFYLDRSSQSTWTAPRTLWLWILFLVLTTYPAIRGSSSLYDALFYYPNVIFASFILCWLGAVVARDMASVREIFKWLALFGALLAVVTIVQATTGKLLFGTTRYDAYVAQLANSQVNGFEQATSTVSRVGSYLLDPNWNGTLFGTLGFIPLGLFFDSKIFLAKTLYLIETLIMLPALLYTFSTGGWIGLFAGFVAFIVFVGSVRYRILLPLILFAGAVVLLVFFPREIALQFQHGVNAAEWSLRISAWQTALAVIRAFPLTGIGLGFSTYLVGAEPYRVPGQRIPLAHPHDSYLELGAMAGLPVLVVFLALVVGALWFAVRNWGSADIRSRSLLGGGIACVVALSVNSLSINGWTLPPLAAIGWLILGSISSPLLARALAARPQHGGKDLYRDSAPAAGG